VLLGRRFLPERLVDALFELLRMPSAALPTLLILFWGTFGSVEMGWRVFFWIFSTFWRVGSYSCASITKHQAANYPCFEPQAKSINTLLHIIVYYYVFILYYYLFTI